MRAVSAALAFIAPSAAAQGWRVDAAHLGSTARVLIIGARPEDEDNALIAWLSLGRSVETAYLSLTRGESGVNVAGTERQSALGVVRTAELLAERQRDGAHQYFTRAYDFGSTKSDSVMNVAWPHDSLVKDVVSVLRAFRPHVIISLFDADSSERDATRREAARLAREAFSLAADTARLSARQTSRLPAWAASRLLTRIDSTGAGRPGVVAVNVGELDRATGRTYAEMGAEIRLLQRTQPAPPAPPTGRAVRLFRLDSARTARDVSHLFAGIDTTWNRLRAGVSENIQTLLDSLGADLRDVRGSAQNGSPDSLASSLARIVKRASDIRLGMSCNDVDGVPACPGTLGDLAVSLNRINQRAIPAAFRAAGIIIDGTVERELVAVGDSVPFAITLFNGGKSPVTIRRLAATSRQSLTTLFRDSSVVIAADSAARWTGGVRVRSASLHWWQMNGLVSGTALHAIANAHDPVIGQLISGEDRIPTTGVEATVVIGGIDVPIIERPLVHRPPGIVRGDNRRALAGVTPVSVILERTAEYERAGIRVDRLFRVFLSSARTAPETLVVSLRLPPGLKADSASRTVVLPPLAARNVFFRLRGTMTPGSDSIFASAEAARTASSVRSSKAMVGFNTSSYSYGVITHEYPHIPTQRFVRSSKQRLESVDLRVPARLRIAYVKGTDDVQPPLGQLQVNLQALDPSLLSVVDLSWYTTVVIGAGALANDALAGAVPSLREFMRNGGTVVVLPGGDEVARSDLLPYPITFDSVPARVSDGEAAIRVTDPKSQLLNWPNVITAKDFADWSGERARNVPATFDPRYRALFSVGDPGQPPTAATLLVAPIGRGMIVYSSLSLDRQLIAVNPGAARLFVNLLAAGLKPGDPK